MKTRDFIIALAAMSLVVLVLAGTPSALMADDQDRIQSWQDGGDHLDDPMIQLQLRIHLEDDAVLTATEAEVPGVPDQDRIRSWEDGGDHLEEPIQDRDRDQDHDDAELTATEAEVPGVPDQDRIRSWEDGGDHLEEPVQDRDRLKDGSCCEDTGLSDVEIAQLEPAIAEALAINGGDAKTVRKMIQKAVGEGCVGDCLTARLHRWNRLMKQEQNTTGDEGGAMTRERNRERDREGNEEPGGEVNQEQNQEQNQAGSEEPGGEQVQEQAQQQTQEQGSEPDGEQNQAGGSEGGAKGR